MPQTLNCPSCGAPLQYDGHSPSVKCGFCNNVTLLPEAFRETALASQSVSFGAGDLSQSLPLDKLMEIKDQLGRGRKIEAIKIFRETFHVSLREAKEAVEQLERGESVNLVSGQQISAFQEGQGAVHVGPSSNVPGQVVLGGKSPAGTNQRAGCVWAFLGRFGCLLFLFFWIPFIIVMVGPAIYPDMVLITAPLACEEGYQEVYSERVGYYSTGNFEGNNIALLHCVYEAGADDIPHPFKVDLILFAGPMAVMTVLAFGIVLFGQVKSFANI